MEFMAHNLISLNYAHSCVEMNDTTLSPMGIHHNRPEYDNLNINKWFKFDNNSMLRDKTNEPPITAVPEYKKILVEDLRNLQLKEDYLRNLGIDQINKLQSPLKEYLEDIYKLPTSHCFDYNNIKTLGHDTPVAEMDENYELDETEAINKINKNNLTEFQNKYISTKDYKSLPVTVKIACWEKHANLNKKFKDAKARIEIKESNFALLNKLNRIHTLKEINESLKTVHYTKKECTDYNRNGDVITLKNNTYNPKIFVQHISKTHDKEVGTPFFIDSNTYEAIVNNFDSQIDPELTNLDKNSKFYDYLWNLKNINYSEKKQFTEKYFKLH
ncbi:unnamed protein product, partial [Rotaria socialis]